MSLVTLQYQDLLDGKDLSAEIYRAYGPTGLGALTIAGIPRFAELRKDLLHLAYTLAHLPQEKLAKLEDPESLWNVGWSHGKEKLGAYADFAKGSFYANPLYDALAEKEVQKAYPSLHPNNRWPSADLPELEPAFKALGRVMYDAAVLVAKQIDAVVHRALPTYKANALHRELAKTHRVKGRLLYYYPTESEAEDSWIGWHNDSGFLTALTSAIFFDDATGKPMPNPDPKGGLWIVNRGHEAVRVQIPEDHLAVQIGECIQVMSGGHLVATPHAVRASKSPAGARVGRATFPVFVDTEIDYPLSAPAGVSREQVFDKTVHSKVPPLEKRWTHDGQLFKDFLHATFSKFYEHNNDSQTKAPEAM